MNHPTRNRSKTSEWLALVGFIVLAFCAPLAAAVSPPGEWYQALQKPSWNPPAWIFAPVWTVLYLMMAVAAWLVWKKVGWGRAMWIYLLQLVLNAAWSPVFFGASQIGWALVVIIALWFSIVATILAFRRDNPLSAFLLTPYLAWVSFATFLNFTLWRLNP